MKFLLSTEKRTPQRAKHPSLPVLGQQTQHDPCQQCSGANLIAATPRPFAPRLILWEIWASLAREPVHLHKACFRLSVMRALGLPPSASHLQASAARRGGTDPSLTPKHVASTEYLEHQIPLKGYSPEVSPHRSTTKTSTIPSTRPEQSY